MKTFDYYEAVALVCPGVILIMGVNLFFPGILNMTSLSRMLDISIGAVALQLIIAFICGHYIQFLGKYFERSFWFFHKGMPTTWINTTGKLFSGQQYDNIVTNLAQDGFDVKSEIDWNALHVWIRNKIDDSSKKIYIFNSQYALFRGLSVVWIVLTIASLAQIVFYRTGSWWYCFICVVLAILSIVRMEYFGIYYARELYGKYLAIVQKEHTPRNIIA